MNTDQLLEVSETFGPAAQGEGPHAGRRCYFVRLARCDLDCRFCDTPWTWKWKGLFVATEDQPTYDPAEQVHPMTVGQVLDRIDPTGLVVVSGGEPMLQRRGLFSLAAAVRDRGGSVDIETNGRHAPADELVDEVDLFVVSPKLASSGVSKTKAWREPALARFVELARDGRAVFKFVIGGMVDLDEAVALVDHLDAPAGAVWAMPEGRDAETVARRGRWLADRVLARGWNLSGRLHVTLWGDERGR